jgi:hypothetical protein
MTPPDVDLRGFEFMPLDTTRLLDSDLFALSTGEEFKAAVALWCKSWHQLPGGSLPADDRVLAHLSGARARWSKVRDVALRGWVECSDGRLYHPLIAEKAVDAWASRVKHEAKREAERKRLQEWREKRRRNASETRTETADETRTKLVGEGEGERYPPIAPPSVEARTVDPPAGGKPKTARTRRVETAMPDGFGVSERVRTWAAAKGYDRLEAHLEHFVGAAKAKAYRYADWDQAFMNAVRDDWARLREPLRANGRSNGIVVAHPSSATPDEATMRRISESCGGLAVERLSDGRYRCGVHFFRPDGRREVLA